MPQSAQEPVALALDRAELESVLQSPIFLRAPTLRRLLSYLCEKAFSGEIDSIKEYSIAVDVFGRGESFDQDADSIVRVEVNRLRKRLAEFYAAEGLGHAIRIAIPVGQYVPVFDQVSLSMAGSDSPFHSERVAIPATQSGRAWLVRILIFVTVVAAAVIFLIRGRLTQRNPKTAISSESVVTEPQSAIPAKAGDAVRILVGSSRSYVDHSGKLWSPDSHFSGGTTVRSATQRIWRTQDPVIYRSSRQGEFSYDIPLERGTYELRLHFSENYYGPEEASGGGEGSRVMSIRANDEVLLTDFDVVADAGASRTADVKVFTNIRPAADGRLHLSFMSAAGAPAMLSGIEIVSGTSGRIKPVRIVARDLPYYSDDSEWWASDSYFKGGQLASGLEPAEGTRDPELYETERWGHFSYAIPVTPGKYTVMLHFIDHRLASSGQAPEEERVFNVFCNGQRILARLNIVREVGGNHALIRRVENLEPNSQGKLLLEFVPVSNYATVSAIQVIPQ